MELPNGHENRIIKISVRSYRLYLDLYKYIHLVSPCSLIAYFSFGSLWLNAMKRKCEWDREKKTTWSGFFHLFMLLLSVTSFSSSSFFFFLKKKYFWTNKKKHLILCRIRTKFWYFYANQINVVEISSFHRNYLTKSTNNSRFKVYVN